MKLGLDQTQFILRLPDVTAQSLLHESNMNSRNYLAIREHIWCCTQESKKGARHWKIKNGATTKSLWPLDSGSVLVIALGWSTKANRHFATFQFNPSRLTAEAAIELLASIEQMFWFEYDEFFARAECTYLEIPLDVVGARMADYFFFDTRLKTYNAAYEKNGTLYLGSRTSSRFITVYDKAKEVADKGGPVCLGEWLRIEPHIRPKVPADQIHALHNPFTTVRVIDRAKLAAIDGNKALDTFRNRVMSGIQPQAAYLAAADKKALLAGLESARADWFEPEVLWKMYPSAAYRITGKGLHACAGVPYMPPPIWPPVWPDGVKELTIPGGLLING